MRALIVIALALVCASCSKADANKTSADLKAAAAHVKNDPAVKQVGTDIKVAAKDAGTEIKKGAEDARTGLKKAGADLKSSADKAKTDLKSKSDQPSDQG